MRVLTFKDGDLPSYFDEKNENISNSRSLKEILIDNHTTQENKVKVFGILG